MDQKLEEIVAYTQKKFGLNAYSLNNHSFFREKDIFNNTAYILSMEWTPTESGPAGNAVIEMNFHTQAVIRIGFVQDVTFADSAVYPSSDKESVIEWVEDLTGLTFGRQFLLIEDEKDVLSFGAAVDNIPVAPTGTIQIEFNDEGQLSLFSIDGHFPDEEEISWEPFALTPDKYEAFAKQQCKLVEMPDEDQGRWLPVYGIEEIYLTNDGKRTIPFEAELGTTIKKDVLLEWEEPAAEAFNEKEINLSNEVTLRQALDNEPHPDAFLITDADADACERETILFLQAVFPEDSGKWKLSRIYREHGYFITELRPVGGTNRVVGRKIKLMINPENFEAVSYIDNDRLLDMFSHLKEAERPVISVEEAFEKLREHVEIDPVYVYDNEQESYIICGKLDCPYGVDAVTGELLLLGAF